MPLNNSSEVVDDYELNADMLIDALSTMRETFEKGTSEFALITTLKQPPFHFFDDDALRDPLMLFRTHFILFHALYRLKVLWRESGVGELTIHTLNIKLLSQQATTSGTLHSSNELHEHDALAAYYLTWSNFQQTDVQDVEGLLNDFWEKMVRGDSLFLTDDEVKDAHNTLEITPDEHAHISFTTLKKCYKKALLKVHPDKGGGQEEAQEVIRAFKVLKQHYSSSATANVIDR